MIGRIGLAMLFLISIMGAGRLAAQEGHPDNPGPSFKVSLLDAVDPYSPAFLLSYEQPFSLTFSVQVEGGIIHTFEGKWILRETMDGFKSRVEVRKYWPFLAPKDFVYIGLQGMFKKVRYLDQNDIFCRDDCNFFQRMDFTETNSVAAMHMSLGLIFLGGQHIIFDIGGFGGFRYNNRIYKGIPDDAIRQSVPIFRSPAKNIYPSLGFTMKIGFAW